MSRESVNLQTGRTHYTHTSTPGREKDNRQAEQVELAAESVIVIEGRNHVPCGRREVGAGAVGAICGGGGIGVDFRGNRLKHANTPRVATGLDTCVTPYLEFKGLPT